MNMVFNRPQDMQNKENRFEEKRREKGQSLEEKKGRAAARQLCINSNTRVCQDMHAHGMRERCRHTITEAEKKTSPTFTTTCVRGMECWVDRDRAF